MFLLCFYLICVCRIVINATTTTTTMNYLTCLLTYLLTYLRHRLYWTAVVKRGVDVCAGGSQVSRHREHTGPTRFPTRRNAESLASKSGKRRQWWSGCSCTRRSDAGGAVPRGGRRRGAAARARPPLRPRLPAHPRRRRARLLLGPLPTLPTARHRRRQRRRRQDGTCNEHHATSSQWNGSE